MSEQQINDGGPAFPVSETGHRESKPLSRVTPRQRAWFAGQVLAGMYTNPDFIHEDVAGLARVAVRQADALIAELESK